MPSPSIGAHAPHVTLHDTNRKPVTVPEHGVVTVLAFFPAAFTGVCTRELCTVRDRMPQLGDARVYGVSVDSPFALAEFKKQNHIEYALLSDHKHEAIRAYDVVFPDLAKIGYEAARRSVFVIGKDGNVAWSWLSDSPEQEPNYDTLRDAVATAAKH